MRSCIHAVLLLTAGGAAAQAPPAAFVATPLPHSMAASPKVMLVKPGSAVAALSDAQQFEQRTHWIQANDNAKDFLARNGLVADARTIAAFRALNPQVGADGAIPAGSRVSLFAPKPAIAANLDAVGAKASVDMAHVARYSVSGEALRARKVKQQTLALPASAYTRAGDIKVHRALVSDIDTTAMLVAQRADKMSARDLALSKYYLASANDAASSTRATAYFKPLTEGNITQLQSAVAPVQEMRMMMSTGGAPFKYRRVTVSVASKPGTGNAPPLRVYVLPVGMIESPGKYDEELLMKLLAELTFERLTSPARATVPFGEIRIWVGPDGQYEAMARMVREKKAFGFTPVKGTSADDEELLLTFVAPDDVVNP